MDKKKPVFEIHLENYADALHLENGDHSSLGYFWWIMFKCQDFEVRPTIYYLKRYEDFANTARIANYEVKSHGVYHNYDEKADRSPYFNQEGLPFPPSGGFFFRLLPVFYLKWAIRKSGICWLHPHDLDEDHPKLKNPFMNWKRHVGLKGAKAKLERLLKEIDWHDPRA